MSESQISLQKTFRLTSNYRHAEAWHAEAQRKQNTREADYAAVGTTASIFTVMLWKTLSLHK